MVHTTGKDAQQTVVRNATAEDNPRVLVEATEHEVQNLASNVVKVSALVC